jgi:hypothetical protein
MNNRAEGKLRIVLPGGASQDARAAFQEGEVPNASPPDLSYRLVFSGPETFPTQILDPGTLALTLSLALGNWTIRAEAFTPEGELYGSGEFSVTVAAGRTNEAPITMRRAFARITAFSFADPAAIGVVDPDTKTIDVRVPFNTVVTNLVPEITVSPGAAVSPASRVARDFTDPVTYTVTAADGSVQAYEVTVNVQEQNTILLAGTVTVVKPDSLVLTGITVTAYKEAERTTVIGTAAFSPGEEWGMEFPAASLADSAWFRVSATDGTNSYTVDAGDSGAIPAGGITNLALSLAIYRIAIDSAMTGGSVAADKRYETAGNTIGLTVTPDTDYRLKSGTLKYSGGDVDYPITGSGSEYSFAMPASDVTIGAFFNRILGFTVEGPADKTIAVTMAHSAGGEPATDISWSGDESVTLTLESPGYRAEDGNLKWIVNGTELSIAGGNSLAIRARDYVQRSYTVTVMIKEDGQWYSTETPFRVME